MSSSSCIPYITLKLITSLEFNMFTEESSSVLGKNGSVIQVMWEISS